MLCSNCGAKTQEGQKFCSGCGKLLSNNKEQVKEDPTPTTENPKKNKFNAGSIISVIFVVLIIGMGVYNSLDEDSIEKNNQALSDFQSGDSETAIKNLQKATDDAYTDETKLNTLKNLAYVYSTETQYDKALKTFKEALLLTKINTFDFYLISGEIALLENKPDTALSNYKKAYELNKNDYQINNTLALFYIDIEDQYPKFADYPKALTYAKKAYQLDPTKSEIAKQNLAIAYYFNEDYDQTISLLSSTNLTQHPYAGLWLGFAYLGKEDYENAKLVFQKAIDGGAEVPQEIYDYLNN